MRANSLALRLFLSATVWTVIILLVTGFVLSGLYRQAVERAFDRRLGVYLKTLIADIAAPEIPMEKTGQSLGEPLFELPLSGWYWQVQRLDSSRVEAQSSRSLWDSVLPRLDERNIAAATDGTRKAYVVGPEEQQLRLVERVIDLGDEGRFLVAVAGDATEIEDEFTAFDRALAITFVVLAVVLLLTTLFQVRFGLAPLKRISESLAAIRCGTAERARRPVPGRDRAARPRNQRAARIQSRDRRTRAHPRRQSCACAQDAVVGHCQRGSGARRRPARRQGERAEPTSCATR